jgi:hypothetical protein
MTINRTLLSLVVLALPNTAVAQRFAGVMDASGMVARSVLSSAVTPSRPLTLLSSSTVLPPPGAGFFTPPGALPQVVFADTTARFVVQPVFIAVPVAVAPSEVIDVPLDAEAFAGVRSDARALAPRRSTSAATFRTPGTTAFAPVVDEPTTSGSAIGRCQTAALRQLRANVRPAELRLGANSTASSRRTDAIEVRGGGILRDEAAGQWRAFRYVCTYSVPTLQARAVVTLQ